MGAHLIGALGSQHAGLDLSWPINASVSLLLVVVAALLLMEVLGLRYIPNNRVGIVEKLWSSDGSVPEGHIIALDGEAGYQAELLRGGFHFGLWRWQYRIHKVSLVAVPQGKVGYVYARDGQSLLPSQTLGRVADSNNFQDARSFLGHREGQDPLATGQRGRQRAILREGVYAINVALFIVITEDGVYRLKVPGQKELEAAVDWQRQLLEFDGFSPLVIGARWWSAIRSIPIVKWRSTASAS